MQDPNTPQRFPVTDDMDDYLLPNIEHEDLVFEEQEKEMDKINNLDD